MQEEEWGHFIDLEIGQPIKETTIQNKSQLKSDSRNSNQTNSESMPPPPPNTRHPPKKKEIQPIVTKKVNNLTVIYEEEIWYKRDEEDDNDYGSNWNYIYAAPKEKKNKRNEYIKNASCIIYCFICISFISWSSVVSL